MNIPADLRYTASHEWVRKEADGTVTVGITDHAQEALGDLVFIELPALARQLAAGEACAVVESVKAASDIYAPVAGEVVAVNDAVTAAPEGGQPGRLRGLAVPARGSGRRHRALLDAAGYQAALGDA
ncbi:MAG: glycine cleavage system protein GcvH [Betaproteobacteria bacterium]|nr:glycine cleavage system protein GcvH [Betaproteobacteria bacterium]